MQRQALKSITIGGLIISETAEGNTVALSINDQMTFLTKEDFYRLLEAGKEFFTKKTTVKCAVCGHELVGTLDFSKNTAILTIEPCYVCARKEPASHENT